MLHLTEEERLLEQRKGEQRGRKEGREEGKEEERIKMIKNLFKRGMEIAFVSEITGLSEEEIKLLN